MSRIFSMFNYLKIHSTQVGQVINDVNEKTEVNKPFVKFKKYYWAIH